MKKKNCNVLNANIKKKTQQNSGVYQFVLTSLMVRHGYELFISKEFRG